MSATIDPAHFAKYFSLPIGDRLYPAPVLEVEKSTNFKVEVFYINALGELGSNLVSNSFVLERLLLWHILLI